MLQKNRTERKWKLLLQNTDMNPGDNVISLSYLEQRTNSDLAFYNSYEDGTSTKREPHKACKTAEVGHSRLWAQPWVMFGYTSC